MALSRNLALNLAALTDEELHLLFGDEGALALLPGVSRARLNRRPEPGPALPGALQVRPLPGRLWGGTPEQSRVLARLDAGLHAAGASPQGTVTQGTAAWETVARETVAWEDGDSGDYLMPYLRSPDTAIVLRWNEQGAPGAVLEALTWLRDQASGISGVLTTSRDQATVPAPSEGLDVHHLPGLDVGEWLELHSGYVLRHGRTQKLGPGPDWWTPWHQLYDLNLSAWARRGLVLGLPPV